MIKWIIGIIGLLLGAFILTKNPHKEVQRYHDDKIKKIKNTPDPDPITDTTSAADFLNELLRKIKR